MIGWLQRLVDAILGRLPGKVGRFDTATRIIRDADFRAAPVGRSAAQGFYSVPRNNALIRFNSVRSKSKPDHKLASAGQETGTMVATRKPIDARSRYS